MGRRVLHDVVERLLADPVEAVLDLVRQPLVELGLDDDRQPDPALDGRRLAPEGGHEPVLLEPAGAQLEDERAHLGERVALEVAQRGEPLPAAAGSLVSSSSMLRVIRVMLKSAWVTESWSSRARWARSSRAASSPAWRRRSASRRSRSRRSRTVPWAPANWPSRWMATPDTSAEIVEPSRWRRSSRARTRSSSPWTSWRQVVVGRVERRGVDDAEIRPADDGAGGPAEQGGRALAPEREVALGVGLPDAVRRGLDEVAEARLGLAQLGLQAGPFAGVARRLRGGR